MRKFIFIVLTITLITLVGCGKEQEENTIVVGATSIPHAEILEEAKPILEEEGITLEIEPYEEYVLPNDDLANETLDANFFQHVPHLEQTIEDTGYDLTHIGSIHIEPMGVYSKGIQSIDEIDNGTEVVLSNSVADHGRILSLFEQNELITLDDSVEPAKATIDDIIDNPRDLVFSPDYDAAFLPEIYETEEDILVVINTNFAIEAGLKPTEDALFIEDEESLYVNVIAVRSEDKEREELKKLVEVLHSEEITNFILKEYDGAVVPVK